MYDYFDIGDAIYEIYNGTHLKHLKEWDKIASLKYYFIPVSIVEYNQAWLIYENTVK